MIRINLLGQTRPKAAKKSVPLEATMQVIFAVVAAIGVALAVLGITYYQQKKELDQTNDRIAALRAERASLQQIKQEVDQIREREVRPPAADRRDRDFTAQSQRSARLAADGGEHDRPRRLASG